MDREIEVSHKEVQKEKVEAKKDKSTHFKVLCLCVFIF